MRMVCSPRLDKSSLCIWTLLTGLGQWYVAHDEGKRIFYTRTLCTGLDNGMHLKMGKQ